MEELFRHMPFWHPLAAEAGGNAAPQAVAFAWAQDILPTAAALPKNDVLIARRGNAIVLAVVTLSLVLTSYSMTNNLMLGALGIDWEMLWLWLVARASNSLPCTRPGSRGFSQPTCSATLCEPSRQRANAVPSLV